MTENNNSVPPIVSPKGYVCEVLTKQELESIFDSQAMKVFDYLIKCACFSLPEKHPDEKHSDTFDLPQENFEKWVQQAIGGHCVGAGNRAIDFIQKGKFIADIKSVAANIDEDFIFEPGISNESSLAQKFSEEGGNNLDILFSEKKYEEILTTWLKLYKTKIEEETSLNPDCKEFYYFWFIKTRPMKYLAVVGFKINMSNLENVSFIVKDELKKDGTEKKVKSKSLWLKNFIDENHGDVKIYASKKRLEMRLKPFHLKDNMIKLPISVKPIVKDLRKELMKTSVSKLIHQKVKTQYPTDEEE